VIAAEIIARGRLRRLEDEGSYKENTNRRNTPKSHLLSSTVGTARPQLVGAPLSLCPWTIRSSTASRHSLTSTRIRF